VVELVALYNGMLGVAAELPLMGAATDQQEFAKNLSPNSAMGEHSTCNFRVHSVRAV
jgi:hypothetical protein